MPDEEVRERCLSKTPNCFPYLCWVEQKETWASAFLGLRLQIKKKIADMLLFSHPLLNVWKGA